VNTIRNVKAIGDLCEFRNGRGFSASEWAETGWPIIRIQNLNGSKGFNYFNGQTQDSWFVESGDLLFAWAGTRGVSFGPTIWDGPKGVLNQHIFKVIPKPGVDKRWLLGALKIATARIEQKAHGFKSTLLHVQKADITEQTIYTPSFNVQEKIAGILEYWEHSISKIEELITAKQEQRKGSMQQLLSGKRRFPEFVQSPERKEARWGSFPVDWGLPCIGDIAKQVAAKNKDGKQLPVLSCTKHHGLVDSLKYFGKQIFSKDLSTYKVVKRNQFAYATNHIEEGSIGYQDLYDEAAISPMYTAFETDDRINDRFLYLLLKTELYRHIFGAKTSASVDRRGSLRWKEFSKIHIPLPSMDEQEAIVSVFDYCDQELDLLGQQLDAFKEQKKGLMQQLLTGKIRVRADSEVADAI